MSHEDVVPYRNTSMDPFVHELFGQFLVPSDDNSDEGILQAKVTWVALGNSLKLLFCAGPLFVPREVLNLWREKNHHWLELSEVHCETTQGVKVTVMPFYMGWRQSSRVKVHWWR